MPRRASWTARSVPEAPPPTIATEIRSDFVVRPGLRICRARFTLHHVRVHVRDCLARGLREHAGNHRMDKASAPRADQAHADRHCADAMSRPAHPERAWMLQEQAVGQSRAILGPLLRRHPSTPIILATPTGFEPVAYRLGICRSILLSYGVVEAGE